MLQQPQIFEFEEICKVHQFGIQKGTKHFKAAVGKKNVQQTKQSGEPTSVISNGEHSVNANFPTSVEWPYQKQNTEEPNQVSA